MGVLLAQIGPAAETIPGWFYVLLSSAFGVLLLALIKREFSRWDARQDRFERALEKMVDAHADHDRRLIRLEARDDLGKEIAEALRRPAA